MMLEASCHASCPITRSTRDKSSPVGLGSCAGRDTSLVLGAGTERRMVECASSYPVITSLLSTESPVEPLLDSHVEPSGRAILLDLEEEEEEETARRWGCESRPCPHPSLQHPRQDEDVRTPFHNPRPAQLRRHVSDHADRRIHTAAITPRDGLSSKFAYFISYGLYADRDRQAGPRVHKSVSAAGCSSSGCYAFQTGSNRVSLCRGIQT